MLAGLRHKCRLSLEMNFLTHSTYAISKIAAPGAPIIILDECGAMKNSITISWRAAINQSPVDAFVLEITDHDDAKAFRVSQEFMWI